jgi:hypothetical protein
MNGIILPLGHPRYLLVSAEPAAPKGSPRAVVSVSFTKKGE